MYLYTGFYPIPYYVSHFLSDSNKTLSMHNLRKERFILIHSSVHNQLTPRLAEEPNTQEVVREVEEKGRKIHPSRPGLQ